MTNEREELAKDPQYLLGYIDAVRALVLAVAGVALDQEEFRDSSLLRLERLRTGLHAEPVSDLRLRAIDDCETWVKRLTD